MIGTEAGTTETAIATTIGGDACHFLGNLPVLPASVPSFESLDPLRVEALAFVLGGRGKTLPCYDEPGTFEALVDEARCNKTASGHSFKEQRTPGAMTNNSLALYNPHMPGTLFVVATPIGNLADITYRAVKVLGEVDVIACEDTRHTRHLLQHFGITTKTISYHEHNEKERGDQLIASLRDGKNVAVVSDAGTPAISDPGFRLVRAAIEAEIAVVPIPGPSALITALVAAGVPTDEFFFGGFLPARTNARQLKLRELASISATLVFYEAPHRLAATLQAALAILGERQAVVARELTKLHEELRRGRLSELAAHYAHEDPRGEIVLIIDRNVLTAQDESPSVSIMQLVARFEAEGSDHRAALKKAARELGLSRAEAYRQLQTERGRY